MKKIVRQNGELYLLDTENDECVFDGQENTGPRQNRWLEVYMHPVDGQDPIWYIAHMTRFQDENSFLDAVSKDVAADIVGGNLDHMDEEQIQYLDAIGLFKFAELK